MTRRVLHVAQPTAQGVAVCTFQFAADHVARGWDVAVACPVEGDLPRWLADAGIVHLPWNASRNPGPRVPAETRSLRQVVKRFAPDVLHLHSSKAGLAGRLSGRLARAVVFQPHAWSFEATGRWMGSAAALWERTAASRTDAIVCVSEAELQRGRDRGITGEYRVIPNGVDLTRWLPVTDSEHMAARKELGIPDVPTVVCVGRLSVQKGQDVLLEAWTEVASAIGDARLVLIGDGPEEERLRARAPGSVDLVGRREDVSTWLAAADVVVIPSRWEGMSLSMLEAMARQRSIVASDVAGAAEALGDAGAIVPVEAPGPLAAAVIERLREPEVRTAEGRLARRRVEESFDLAVTLESVADLYDEIGMDQA